MSTVDVGADLFWKTVADPRGGTIELARSAQRLPYFVPVSSPLGRATTVGGGERLMFGSNNYLGLADDPRVRDAAKRAVDEYGTGCTGSRLMNGTLDLHLQLEAELADWVGADDALCFTAGYLANLAGVSTMCVEGDVIVTDARNHASIHDGARLSAASVVTVRHGDINQLQRKLGRLDHAGGTLVVWDAVFSMEGEVAPVEAVVDAARAAGARTLIDEAHSLGVLGPDGAGLGAGLPNRPDLVMGTFSKSLASCGGFLAGERGVIDYLRTRARPFLFTASGVPAACAAALEAIRIARAEAWRREAVLARAGQLASGLAELGLDITWQGAAIVSVRAPSEWSAITAWRALLDAGVYVNVGVFPAVPSGSAILRLSTVADHRSEDVDRCVEAFAPLADLLIAR
jgi:8-amino-7-oxononanoate synthase